MLKKNILITGCAGFIGYHLCRSLSKQTNLNIIGIDNINSYYDVDLKKERLHSLKLNNKNFNFHKIDIRSQKKLEILFKKYKFETVIHLAAQAGVRHSVDFPKSYLDNNIVGFFNTIDMSRQYNINHFIFASTSSVYGDAKKFPVKEIDSTDKPMSFYAATKKSNEVMAYSYANIYKLPTTALRFFTVYGTLGRPDMALFNFTKSILQNKKIKLFNKGNHYRDFTHVSDVVISIKKLISKPSKQKIPYQVYNIASDDSQYLMNFIREIEKSTGHKAIIENLPMQIGDVKKTHGSISLLKSKIRFKPRIRIKKGVNEFVKWYKKFYKIN